MLHETPGRVPSKIDFVHVTPKRRTYILLSGGNEEERGDESLLSDFLKSHKSSILVFCASAILVERT